MTRVVNIGLDANTSNFNELVQSGAFQGLQYELTCLFWLIFVKPNLLNNVRIFLLLEPLQDIGLDHGLLQYVLDVAPHLLDRVFLLIRLPGAALDSCEASLDPKRELSGKIQLTSPNWVECSDSSTEYSDSNLIIFSPAVDAKCKLIYYLTFNS